MGTFLTALTGPQLALVAQRAAVTEVQAPSATGQLVAGADPGETYLDDPAGLFRTNGVAAENIVQITAGPTSPLGFYTVAGPYLDPRVDAAVAVPEETRLILNGYSTLGGPVTYRILESTPILEALAQIDEARSLAENVVDPEIQVLDDLFTAFHDQFNIVCNGVADVHASLLGLDRTRVTAGLINTSAAFTVGTALFPDDYTELAPNRTGVFAGFPNPIDVFNLAVGGSEQAGKTAEEAAEPASSGGPLLAAYLAALGVQSAALLAQDAALAALQAEVAANDTPGEAGDLSAFYTALSAVLAAQRASIVLRQADIAAIILADDTRPNVGGLNFGSFAALQAELTLRSGELQSAPFAAFLNLRYTYLDLLVNRGFGTRSELAASAAQLAAEAARRQTLLDDLETERDLLGLVP